MGTSFPNGGQTDHRIVRTVYPQKPVESKSWAQVPPLADEYLRTPSPGATWERANLFTDVP
ncbi:MAG: hypothetical protein MUF18_13350 [Fimbriiglobus sp.]|nr:hypothetical protein [Fimbriiglobus sp.]